VKIDAAATNIDGLAASAWITPEERDLGRIVEVHRHTFQSGGSGTLEVSTLPRGNGDLKALHVVSSLVSAAEVEMNGVSFSDVEVNTINHLLQNTNPPRVPQADTIHIDPVALSGYAGDAYPVAFAEDFRLKLTTTGAGQVPIVMETISAPLGFNSV